MALSLGAPFRHSPRTPVRDSYLQCVPQAHDTFPTHPYFIYAEDDTNSVVLMRAALRKLNAEDCLIHCPDGDALIACLRDAIISRCVPAFVLLDLRMPRAGGFEALRWIGAMEKLKNLPVIVLTSSALPEDVELAVALGAASYMVKPPSYEEFCREINELLTRFGVAQGSQRKDRPGS